MTIDVDADQRIGLKLSDRASSHSVDVAVNDSTASEARASVRAEGLSYLSVPDGARANRPESPELPADVHVVNGAVDHSPASREESAQPPPDAAVFISFESGDRAYVVQLASHLRHHGIPVWYDGDLLPGDQWTRELERRIEDATAVVAVVSEHSRASRWMANEVSYAMDLGKQILPLRRASVPFLPLYHLQHEDVTDGSMPTDRFLESLRSAIRHPGRRY